LPEDDALKALFDRFLLRVHCDNVAAEQLPEVLDAGWKLGDNRPAPSSLHFDDVQSLQALLSQVELSAIRTEYAELVHRIRHAGIPVSDRRAVKLQRLIAGSALICGRLQARFSDLWVLKYIWDTEEQQEVLGALVQKVLEKSEPNEGDHARASGVHGPNPESLARDLDYIEEQLKSEPNGRSNYLRDRLSLLEGRCQWVSNAAKRDFLVKRVADLWGRFKPTPT
jgi:MoxR-like ATPase